MAFGGVVVSIGDHILLEFEFRDKLPEVGRQFFLCPRRSVSGLAILVSVPLARSSEPKSSEKPLPFWWFQ